MTEIFTPGCFINFIQIPLQAPLGDVGALRQKIRTQVPSIVSTRHSYAFVILANNNAVDTPV